MTTRITREKVRNIIEGAQMAGRNVDSIEIDGVKVNLGQATNDFGTNPADLVDMTR